MVFLNNLRCPFCKTPNYAVEFRGVKTKEEKGMEQIEEQRVIEAKIRIRQKEMLDDKERIQKLQESSCSSSTNTVAADVDNGQAAGQNIGFRDEEFDSDLEDIMVMEAIWLSIQEMSRCEDVVYSDSPGYASEDRYISASSRPISGPLTSSSPSPTSSPLWSLLQSSPSSSTSAFAETSCSNGETSNGGDGSSFNMFLGNSTGYYNLVETNDYPSVHTSCCSSSYDAAEDNSGGISMWKQCEGGVLGTFQGFLPPICPESFEEQMMLAMSGSLAEVHATTSGVVWQ